MSFDFNKCKYEQQAERASAALSGGPLGMERNLEALKTSFTNLKNETDGTTSNAGTTSAARGKAKAGKSKDVGGKKGQPKKRKGQ